MVQKVGLYADTIVRNMLRSASMVDRVMLYITFGIFLFEDHRLRRSFFGPTDRKDWLG